MAELTTGTIATLASAPGYEGMLMPHVTGADEGKAGAGVELAVIGAGTGGEAYNNPALRPAFGHRASDGFMPQVGGASPSGQADIIVPAPDPAELLANLPPANYGGITRVPNGEDIWACLHRLGLLHSVDPGTACCGTVIDMDHIGVLEVQGMVKFARPGQYILWSPWTQWSRPDRHLITDPVIETKGVTILSLTQREVAVARDKDGRSVLLRQGRYILEAPAILLGQSRATKIVSLVALAAKHVQVDRFSFFNVPQGEVAGTTMPNGQIRILLPGVHVEEDTKFERFLPTVPIQSKLRKDVITSDLVTVSLEVDITTQLVDCARFLRMSVGHSSGAAQGMKDLYDALEEPAQSVFIDLFSKYKYYEGRTRQGEEESKFEENALATLDREAQKYGGRVLKVNILKYRADAVEAAYAAHNKQQVELEHQKQSQQRQFEIKDNEQRHRQQMTEREEKHRTQAQVLQHERALAEKEHQLAMNLKEAQAAQTKLDVEAKAIAERQKMQAQAEADAARVRAKGKADADASGILVVAEAEAKAEELRAQARVKAMEALARVVGSNKDLLELERAKTMEELNIKKLQSLVESGARVIPVEMLRMFDVADERLVRRWENQAVLSVAGLQGSGSQFPPLPGAVNSEGGKRDRDDRKRS